MREEGVSRLGCVDAGCDGLYRSLTDLHLEPLSNRVICTDCRDRSACKPISTIPLTNLENLEGGFVAHPVSRTLARAKSAALAEVSAAFDRVEMSHKVCLLRFGAGCPK